MKTRSIKPIREFLRTAKPSTYDIDTQFAEIHYVSDQIAANISARIDACGDVYIIEVEDEQDDIRTRTQPEQ